MNRLAEKASPGYRRGGSAVAALGACLLTVLVGACGATPAPSAATPDGAEPSPPGVAIEKNTTNTGSQLACNPQDSLRPAGPLPSPGHMPPGSTMARIYQRGYLIAGVDQTIYLDSYRDPVTDQLEGFDIDIVRQIAQAIFGHPDRVEFRAITSAQRIPVIRDGAVDLVADSMTITCARQKLVDFSSDYFNAGQTLLVPSDSDVTSIGQLGGQKVCAATGTTSIQQIQEQPSRPVPVAVNNWTDCLVMLEQGQVAAVSTDNSVLAGLAAQDPQTKLTGPLFTSEQHGIAISKNAPDLVRFVNAVLEQMRTDGTWTMLYEKWFGTRLGPVPAPPLPAYRS